MGSIARVLSFERVVKDGVPVSVVKINPDGGSNITAPHFADAGHDSQPLPTDYVVTTTIRGSGREGATGYADPLNAGKSEPGEARIYGRNNSGAPVNEVWLKGDGEIVISNDNGEIKLQPDGEISSENANGRIKLKPNGVVELTGPLSTFKLNATGSVKGSNGAGFFELLSNGDFVVNGLIITAAGAIVSAGGVDLDTHVHPITGGSSAPGPTGPPA